MWKVGCKNDNSANLHFLIMSPDPFVHLISGLYLNNHLKYLNDTLKDYRPGQHAVSGKNEDSAFLHYLP